MQSKRKENLAVVILGVIAVALSALLIAAIVTIAQVQGTRDDLRKQSTQAFHALVVTQLDNCRNDHLFREQNKRRAFAEKKLLTLFVTLAHQNLAAQNPRQKHTSQQFIKTFGPLAESIHVLPPPNCIEVGNRLLNAIPAKFRVPREQVLNHAVGRQARNRR